MPSQDPREFEQNKAAGKAEFTGRRRPATRESGFHSSPQSTGGEYKVVPPEQHQWSYGPNITIKFTFPSHKKGDLLGFGGWYWASQLVDLSAEGFTGRLFHKQYPGQNWSKFGSMWASDGSTKTIEVTLHGRGEFKAAFHELSGGVIKHRHYAEAKPELLANMYQFSPEAFFIPNPCDAVLKPGAPRAIKRSAAPPLTLKCCNRCARFLPFNLTDERATLSFSNHCVAAHRRPCTHKGFGRLTNVETGAPLQLDFGFQLECRFCKKFEVNAALNPQRNSSQMKEDGARRRSFELLLAELFDGSPLLSYRHKHGRELTADIFQKFKGRCFKCRKTLGKASAMHLDHTRPLALLWPLDGTATALCGECNSEKRDRPPVDFYLPEELRDLAKITGLSMTELTHPGANEKAVRLLYERRSWFFNSFLARPDMAEVRDGKVTGDLLIKALQKAINRCPAVKTFDLRSLRTRA
jgi:hypothetical protein